MAPKAKPKGKGAKAPGKKSAPGTPAPDDTNIIKKFAEALNKLSEKYAVTSFQGMAKRIRAVLDDAERPEGTPIFPLLINEPLEFNVIRDFLDALTKYTWLSQLSFWKAKIGDDGLMLIAEFLQKDTRLRTLELLNAGIGSKGCGFLGRVLTQNDTLTNIILDFNDIGDEGVYLLGDGLKWNSAVTYLSMQYCNIGPAGGDAIGKFIRSCSVKELYLKGNILGSPGITSIAQAIAKNMILTKLDLSDNGFGIDLEGIEALRDGIESNESLTYIDVNLNSIVPAGAAMLLEVVKNKQNITQFFIYERVQEDVYNGIIEALKENVKAQKLKGKKGKKGKGKGKKGKDAK